MEELRQSVIAVLKQAAHGKMTSPAWVTAHQVLFRINDQLRSNLLREHGSYGGRDSDTERGRGAVSAVARTLALLRDDGLVEAGTLDIHQDASFAVGEGVWVQPGVVSCGIFRWLGAP
jgi:hypothetical protein